MLTAMNLTLFGRIVLQNQEFFWKFIQQMAHHYHQEVSSVHLVKDITNGISIKASRNFTPLFLYTIQLHINCGLIAPHKYKFNWFVYDLPVLVCFRQTVSLGMCWISGLTIWISSHNQREESYLLWP